MKSDDVIRLGPTFEVHPDLIRCRYFPVLQFFVRNLSDRNATDSWHR